MKLKRWKREDCGVLFRRIAGADGQRAQRRVRHVGGRHGELDVAELAQRFGHLIERRQIDATAEGVRRVGTCAVFFLFDRLLGGTFRTFFF